MTRRDYEPAVAALRAELGEATFTAEYAAGRRLPLADAIVEATAVATTPPDTRTDIAPPPGAALGLSRREAEVLRLVATGQSNREIATALCISERTVENHLLHLLTKLDLPSRTAAAAYAHTHGLA